MKFDEMENRVFFKHHQSQQMQDFKTEMPLQHYVGTVEIQNVARIPCQ